jgi:hypothetical protein
MAVSVLRVEGMREDNRSPEERASLEAAETTPVDMSVASVLQQARHLTGLNDFGSADFTARLDLLLSEVTADNNLWKLHKARFVDHCQKATANRLRVQHYWSQHSDAHDVVIDRPIEVIALPRSGSTHLENLVAADRRLRHLPVYLAAQPAPQPGEEAGADGVDPRWARAAARWEAMSQNRIMAAMHEHSPGHACGENELQIPDFSSYQWEWMAFVPAFRDYYLNHDQTPHYLYMREVLKAIAHQFPGQQRWMLKSNQHSEQLGPLLTAYPDAVVVMIHRDPVATIQSLLTMRGLAFKSSRKRLDIDAHVSYWVDRIERMLRRYIRDRHLVPESQLVEVMFAEIVSDDVAAAGRVLERAGLEVNDESIADIEAYMAAHTRGQAGRVAYDLEGDFAVTAGELRERFTFYTDEFDIQAEVR